jgi:hypothetical protein
MDIGEKNLVQYNLKPWVKHQIVNFTYNNRNDKLVNSVSQVLQNSKVLQQTSFNSIKIREKLLNLLKKTNKTETFEFPYFCHQDRKVNTFSAPQTTRQLMYYNTTWNWLSNCWKRKHFITGRIGRSLRQAGVCVLIGGFIAFLPKGELSFRSKSTIHYQNSLRSVQPIGLRRKNLNVLVTLYKAIKSIWYRF